MDKRMGEGRTEVKLTRCNRVAGQGDGQTGKSRVSRNGRIENPTGWMKIPSRSDRRTRARLRRLARTPAPRSPFPALGRENVITDLINWTYGRRRTKCSHSLPSSCRLTLSLSRSSAATLELLRSGHCLAMITMEVYQL